MNPFKKPTRGAADGKTIPVRLQYGVQESAEKLGISPRNLASMISKGQIESHKHGARRMIKHDTLTDFVEKLSSKEVQNGVNS